ncbi:MAG: isopenicillin N synthase family oxygenase [Acidimicrobiales bacterium]|nr:isopenicillin N synthase family oxygenase [Acidimicrobiales bacterium]
MDRLPVIDVSPLRTDYDLTSAAAREVAGRIDAACRDHGFLLITGHGVDRNSQERLFQAARRFFALPEERKVRVSMDRGGRAWRGWFPLEGELTSGHPDHKEGLYLGEDLRPKDPLVQAGYPLHGPNLLPDDDLPELRPAVDDWLSAMTDLGHLLVRAFGVGLGLGPEWFDTHLTGRPTILMRLFRYPTVAPTPGDDGTKPRLGVGEHTDYGLLTILAHDGRPGLQVHTRNGWIDVASVDGSFVVNLGDMIDRMTGGRYRSTPHRVRTVEGPPGSPDRISVPFFFDPAWDAEVQPLPLRGERPADDAAQRWDRSSVHDWRGTYGDYLTAKVAKVFPQLGADVLP